MRNRAKFVSRIYVPRSVENETATADSVPTEDGGGMFKEISINLCQQKALHCTRTAAVQDAQPTHKLQLADRSVE